MEATANVLNTTISIPLAKGTILPTIELCTYVNNKYILINNNKNKRIASVIIEALKPAKRNMDIEIKLAS